jgi:hypothetical protein
MFRLALALREKFRFQLRVRMRSTENRKLTTEDKRIAECIISIIISNYSPLKLKTSKNI